MILRKMLRGGGLAVLSVLTLLSLFIPLDSAQAANSKTGDPIISGYIDYLLDSNGNVYKDYIHADSSGDGRVAITYVGQIPIKSNPVMMDIPWKGDAAAELNSFVGFTYSDEEGILYDGQVKVSTEIRFKPNTFFGRYFTGPDGILYTVKYAGVSAINGGTRSLVKIGNAPKLKANIPSTGRLFTTAEGKLWTIDDYGNAKELTSTLNGASLLGNQFFDNDGFGDSSAENYYYVDSSGTLTYVKIGEPASATKTIVSGLKPGTLIPGQQALDIADGKGVLYSCGYESPDGNVCTVSKGAPKFAAGTWETEMLSYGARPLVASDSSGTVWIRSRLDASLNSPTLWLKSDQFTMEPNHLKAPAYGSGADQKFIPLFAQAENGIIWRTVLSTTANSSATTSWSPLPQMGDTQSDNGTACVVQMPTTGSPRGLTTVGLIAISIGCLALVIVRRGRI